MADSTADFTLRLKNEVTGPSRKMSQSIRGLSSDLKSQQRFFASGETAFQKKLKERRRVMDRTHRQELGSMRAKRAAMVGSRAGGGVAATAGGIDMPTSPVGALLGAIGAITAAATAAAVAVGMVTAKFVGATLAAVDFGQRSKTALTSILKDGALAAQQFTEVRMEAGKLGLDVTDTVDQFKMLANSGFKVPMARELVKMSADLQALTGSSESAAFALKAISQIKMKGRLQAEEITGQLAEHGVSADEVYKVLGKTLGKTREEILKMQKAGDLSADVAIPAILQAVRNQLGVEQSGGFAMKINASSVGGMWRTLKGQVQNAFISLGEQVGPGITRAFQSIMASIQAAVASPQVAELGRAVVELFNAASAFVQQTNLSGLLMEAAQSLGSEIANAATFIRDHGAELRESFVRFAVAMGTGLGMAVSFFKPLVDFAASDFGRFMFTPLNETFGDEAAVKESKARMAAARSNATGAAAQAGATVSSNRFDVKFGDINVTAPNAEIAGGDIRAQVDKELRAMLQDL